LLYALKTTNPKYIPVNNNICTLIRSIYYKNKLTKFLFMYRVWWMIWEVVIALKHFYFWFVRIQIREQDSCYKFLSKNKVKFSSFNFYFIPCLLLRIFSHSAQAPYTHVGTGLQDTDAPGQAYVLIRARLTISVGRNVARRPGCNKTFEGKAKELSHWPKQWRYTTFLAY